MVQGLRPGYLVVLEGLDKAGKTTQFEQLQDRLAPDAVTFAHMPTGFTPFTRAVRQLLEEQGSKPTSGLAQQLAHLACHAESQAALRAHLVTGAVVLDRWWWSTWAYGWFGGSIKESGMPEEVFERLIASVWDGIEAQVVFLFDSPHEEDANNNPAVAAGYDALSSRFPELALRVPHGEIGDVTDWILSELDRRELLRGV